MRRLIALTVLSASLLIAPASQAASSKQCKRLTGKMTVVLKGKDSLVARRGTMAELNLKYYACLYSRPRLYTIPGQNGGDTELYARFTEAGNFLAYQHIDVEEASTVYPGWLEVVDLKRRKRIAQYDAFPIGPEDEKTTNVARILLQRDGAVAWIGRDDADPDDFSVQTALLGQARPAEVDRGTDVGPTSLRRSAASTDVFSWTRGGVRKEAAFGGPSVTP